MRSATLLALVALAGLGGNAGTQGLTSRAEVVTSASASETREGRGETLGWPHRLWGVEARADFALQSGRLALSAKPRLAFERFEQAQAWGDDGSAFISQALTRVRLTRAWSLSAGREIATWGPAQLRSASNPFYPDNGRANPIRELPGVDLARVSYIPSVRWGVEVLGHLRGGRFAVPGQPFRRSLTCKLDFKGSALAASANLHKAEGRALRGGAYGQLALGQALLVYAESSRSTPAGSPRAAWTALAGGAYTVGSGHTLTAEYLYNGEGLAQAAAGRLFGGALPLPSAPAAGPLAPAPGTGLALPRRHYVFTQVQSPLGQDGRLWQLRYTLGLDDGSGQMAAYAEWTLGSRLAPFVVLSAAHGSRVSGFGWLRERSLQAGTRVFLW